MNDSYRKQLIFLLADLSADEPHISSEIFFHFHPRYVSAYIFLHPFGSHEYLFLTSLAKLLDEYFFSSSKSDSEFKALTDSLTVLIQNEMSAIQHPEVV